MNTHIDIRKTFSNPIILSHYINHCPNDGCYSFDIHCTENYERDGKHISIFECNFCGVYWEMEKNKTEDEMNKEKLIEVLKTIMMIFIGIGILAFMMWMVTLALVATGS